jgi:hypothetical protein
MVEKFEVTDKLKKSCYYMIGAGVLGLVLAFLFYPANSHSRFWANILLNTYYFTGIGIFGIFFVAANQIGYGGWITLIKRIFTSLSGFVKVGAVFTLIIIGGVWLHYHELYHGWSDPELYKKLTNNKQTFLSHGFWTIRIVLYFALWIFLGKAVINSINNKDVNIPRNYKRSKLLAAMWIVIFAVTESFVSWDMVMSLDPHWYSTLFGWYNFASYGCAAFAFTILLLIYIKSKGYLPQVNENHIQDVGKMMFGFSILWSYLWFAQFMLQWYGNIPEDTRYWVLRFDVPLFKFTIFLSLTLNFLAPLLLLIKRGAKRNYKTAAFIAVVVIVGHYIDFFNMTMFEPNKAVKQEKTEGAKEASLPKSTVLYAENKEAASADDKVSNHAVRESKAGVRNADGSAMTETPSESEKNQMEPALKTYAGLGLVELLIFTGFLGGFLLMFFAELSKGPLFNENDPYIKESLRLHVEYA